MHECSEECLKGLLESNKSINQLTCTDPSPACSKLQRHKRSSDLGTHYCMTNCSGQMAHAVRVWSTKFKIAKELNFELRFMNRKLLFREIE